MSERFFGPYLTERIFNSFDPRKPLGIRRFIIYTALYSLFGIFISILFGLMLGKDGFEETVTSFWFKDVLVSVIMAPAWMYSVRRAVAAKIPVQCVYGYMAWTLVFEKICAATIGEGLDQFLAVPFLVLAIGLLFKRNRVDLPYSV